MVRGHRDDDLVLPQQRGRELVAQRAAVERGECAVQLVGASAANTSSCVDSVVWIASKRSK
jgi:hypothetical protein